MKITFKLHDDDDSSRELEVKTVIEGPCLTLDEILTQVEHFVKACGYHPKGQLEFVDDES